MALATRLLNRLRAITRRSTFEHELQNELQDARGARWLDALAGDTRFALGYFRRHKSTVAIIVAVLGLGVGANTLIFVAFQAIFLRPAPGVPDDAGQIRFYVAERATKTAPEKQHDLTRIELTALAGHRELFSAVAAWRPDDVVLNGGDSTGARGVRAQFVTPNYFATLGTRLSAGQGFAPDAESAPDFTAVMSHAMAELLYGTDSASSAIGRRILVNEMPVRIVGVAPPRFQGALREMGKPALWIPMSARAALARVPTRWLDDDASLSIFARLAPDASRDRAEAVVRQIVANTLPDSATRVGMSRTAYVLDMREEPPGAPRIEAVMGFTATAMIGVLILLVAWMNVSSLMVAAAVGRRHEIAVRLSLGASRGRLLRQLVTESTLLALAGGGGGLLLAWGVLTWLSKAVVGADIAPDLGTFAFVLGLALVTGILFGLSPALHATKDGLATALRDSGTAATGRSRLQSTFVAAQITLSQPLLVMLAAMLAAVIAEYQPRSPEMSRRVISVAFRPLMTTGARTQRREAVDSLLPRIAARPEVEGVVPEAAAFESRGILVKDRPRPTASDTVPTIVDVEGVAPGWFGLVEVPIMLGRDVTLADTSAADYPVVIGSDVARSLWNNANPIGRRLPSPRLSGVEQDSIMMTVVGVYDASRGLPGMMWNGAEARGHQPPKFYTARGKHWRADEILVRTRGPAGPFLPTLRRFLRESAPSLPVTQVLTLAQVDEREYDIAVRISMLAGSGGVVALLLASLGLYGVVSLAVQQRRREIGIRIAIGAQPMQVARMFLASGVRVSVVALLLGLPLSIAGLHVAVREGAIIVPTTNVFLIGGGIAALLLAVASAATWVPARRAARVDPAMTLRVE